MNQQVLEAILDTAEAFEIDTPLRLAAFLSQVGHESNRLRTLEENLNYGAEGLVKTFRKYFPTLEIASKYARWPEGIANRVYANRMGNGPEASGDGWKYRGRGAIQLTGRDNYDACSEGLGYDFIQTPNDLSTLPWAIQSAGWFWSENSLNWFADRQDIEGLTKRINGGLNGFDDRQAIYKCACTHMI